MSVEYLHPYVYNMEQLQESYKLFIKNKEFENAEKCLIKMLTINDKDCEIYCNLGYLYYRLAMQLGFDERNDEINRSIEYFLKSLDLNDKHINSLNGLARLYSMKGNSEKSIECYTKSLEIKEDIITRYNMDFVINRLI